MVKNLPTIERSTKIRFGKHANDDQAENTIVFNASDSSITATQTGSVYMTPVRTAEISGSTFLGYVPGTKEVVDTGVLTSLLGGVTLESAADQGNTVSNVVQFINETTGFITSSNVGISNTAPTHALSVKDKVFIGGPTGDPDDLRIEGNTKTTKLQTGTEVTIDKNATNKIQVSGIIKTDKLHADFIGISNVAPTNLISIGPNGETTFNIPTHTTYALSTTGNVNAQNYIGDGGLLSNISLQSVSDKSNITSNTIIFSNNDVGVEALGSIVADGGFFGRIKGSNAIVASTVTATSFTGSGTNITDIDPTHINGAIGVGAGGTGLTSFTEGDIIYANGSASLAVIGPGSASAGQFLKMNSTKTAPEWSDVPLTLDEVLASQTGVSNVSDEVITLSKGSGVAMEIETAQLALNGSGIVLNAPNGVISADTFAGNGSSITHLDLGDATNTGQVSVARGGTGAVNTTGTGDNVLAGSPTINDPTITNGVVISSGGLKQDSLSPLSTPYVNSSGVLEDSKTSFNPGTMVTSISSNVAISGNLNVAGNITAQHTTDHFITDNIFAVAHNNTIDAKDMGQHMTRPAANVFAGFLGQTMANEYTIAYTESKSESQTIVPTLTTPDGYITANVWGNVLAGNVTTTGTIQATNLNIDGIHAGEFLYGTPSGTMSKLSTSGGNGKFLKLTGTTPSWAAVSSDLQTITDGGATTTRTIAFNNATTGLTSAGDIDIAATKQIDYAGDVLLKSSAGAIASLKIDNAIKLDPAHASPTNNVLSFNTSTGEIYDSGGQGGSSLDNIHEYKANVSIGPSVASANLTVNVFESNVLTVSGNVSVDNITIGTLHVAASPFSLDDVAEAHATANVTSNVLQFTGPVNTVLHDNAFITTKSIKIGSNVNATGNLVSQNIQLTNPDITATMSSTDTITIDAKNKSYGTSPLVVLGGDLTSLVYSNLINGAQIVVPFIANGADRNISKTLSNVNWYVQTADVSIKQNDQALMTVSNVAGNVYMNAITFTSGS